MGSLTFSGNRISRRDFLKMTGIGVASCFFGQTRDASALSKNRITIATGTPEGFYFLIGGDIARVLTKYGNIESVAQITAGSFENCELVAAKKSHLGLATVDTVYEGFRGTGHFHGQPLPLRVLTVLYPNLTHIVSLDRKNIRKIGDLKGKRISVGSKGSGNETIAERIISAAALDRASDPKRFNMGFSESAAALKDDKIDAYICSAGIPAASVRELSEQSGLRIDLMDHDDLVSIMNRKYGPVYYKSNIPAGAYKGLKNDVMVSTVANILFCHVDLEEQKAYTVLKILFGNLQGFPSVNKQLNRIDLKAGASLNLIPYHPGAGKFFHENGLNVPV